MNGFSPLVMWIVTGLLAVINVLLGLVLKAHNERDNMTRTELQRQIDKLDHELETVRKRIHDWSSNIGWVDQQRRHEK